MLTDIWLTDVKKYNKKGAYQNTTPKISLNHKMGGVSIISGTLASASGAFSDLCDSFYCAIIMSKLYIFVKSFLFYHPKCFSWLSFAIVLSCLNKQKFYYLSNWPFYESDYKLKFLLETHFNFQFNKEVKLSWKHKSYTVMKLVMTVIT